MTAAAAVGGNVLIENVIPKHLDCITAKLREMGARVTEYDDSIRVESTHRLHRANVKTMPYPGFPTDMLVSNHLFAYDPVVYYYAMPWADLAFLSKKENFSLVMTRSATTWFAR